MHAVGKEYLDNPVLTTRNVLAAAVPPNHTSQCALGLQRILSVKILKTVFSMSFEINLTVGILDGSIILGERYFQRDVLMVFYIKNSLCALWFQKFYKPGSL